MFMNVLSVASGTYIQSLSISLSIFHNSLSSRSIFWNPISTSTPNSLCLFRSLTTCLRLRLPSLLAAVLFISTASCVDKVLLFHPDQLGQCHFGNPLHHFGLSSCLIYLWSPCILVAGKAQLIKMKWFYPLLYVSCHHWLRALRLGGIIMNFYEVVSHSVLMSKSPHRARALLMPATRKDIAYERRVDNGVSSHPPTALRGSEG